MVFKTKRTQIVRFVSIIDPKVDLATTKEEEPETLLSVNEGREIAIGSAARLLFIQTIAAEQEQTLITIELIYMDGI